MSDRNLDSEDGYKRPSTYFGHQFIFKFIDPVSSTS